VPKKQQLCEETKKNSGSQRKSERERECVCVRERERALSESRSNNKRQKLVLAGTVRAIDRRSDPWYRQSPKTRNCFIRSRSSSLSNASSSKLVNGVIANAKRNFVGISASQLLFPASATPPQVQKIGVYI